jgi:DNA-binding SARP family transcriptional activator
MERLRLTFLGGFEARLDAGPTVVVPLRKAQALLAYLALPLGRAHSRDKLAALLWGGMPEAQARSGLRQALFSLRAGGVPPEALSVGRETVALAAATVEADVAMFESRAAAGTPEALAEAAGQYRGDLLAGLSLREPPFEEWLLSERERLREVALEALGRLLAHQWHAGDAEAAVRTALQLLALDPLQEAVHRTLMRLYAGLGRRGAALRQYQLCADVLQRELRTEPEAQTRELYREILRERMLPRDIAETPAVGAAIAEADVAIAPAAQTGLEASLVGRETEHGRLRDSLAQAFSGQGRLVVLLGEAGVGKSRMLAEAAAEAGQRGGRLLTGRAFESDQILSLGLWADAFQSGRVSEDAAALKVLSSASQAALARLLPDAPWTMAEPPAPVDLLQLFHGVAHLFERLAETQPLLVVLEDLHWADEMSLRLLAFVARRLGKQRVRPLAASLPRRAARECRRRGRANASRPGPERGARRCRVRARAGAARPDPR